MPTGNSGAVAHGRPLRRIVVLMLSAFIAMTAVSQEWPNCLTGCTAGDVELVEVTAEISGPPGPDGIVEATLWGSLYFNRNKTYCVRFAADVYVDGVPTSVGLVSEPFNVYSKGAYPAIYLGTLSLPCGSVLSLENVKVMWSVDKNLDPASKCQGCEDYGPGSKCTGDQFESIVVPLPLDAVDDADETDEDAPVTTDVLFNDCLGSPPTQITSVSNGAHGTTRLNGDGTITYTPAPGFYGTDTYTYVIDDGNGKTDSATVTVTVLPINDPPLAGDDTAATDENAFVAIDVTANDSDPDSGIDKTTVTITGNPATGTVDVDPTTGVITYTPDPGTCGSDGFSYTVRDIDGTISNEADVSVDVLCNAPPIARDDFATTDENSSIGINVLANDTDSDGFIDPTAIAITHPPEGGSVSVHPATGVVTYTPDPGTCGIDRFSYTVDDNDGASTDEATVEVDVLCDDPPLAIDDLYGVSEGGTLDVADPGVLANDVTTPQDPLTAVLISDVLHGTLVLHSDGSFTYVHDGSETSSDSFAYLANDGTEDSNVATVSIVITASNDPPAASDDQDSTDEDVPVTIDVLANDNDPDGDSLSVDWVSQPANGTATNNGTNVTYSPDPYFHGVDTFTYTVSDGSGGKAEATVTVTVAPVNDPPVAQDDSDATDEETPVTIRVLANDSDPDGDPLIVEAVAQPAHGTVSSNGSDVTYTPASNFHGVDSFTYSVSDGNGGTATATITVTVVPVNDDPVAQDDSDATDEETPVTIHVLANDSDPDGDPLFVGSISRPANGTVANNGTDVVYTPDPDFHGVDTFTYSASDGNGGTATASVTVTVAPVNDGPVAQDDSGATDEETPVTIDVLANDSDPDSDPLLVGSITQPANGTVTNDGTHVTYSPDPDFFGVDSFTYTVSDGNGGASEATVTVTVAAVNDPPVARDDSDATNEEAPVTIDVLANDSDPDGDPLSIESVTQPSHGTVVNNGSDVIYTPDPDFFGVDTFTYAVCDGNGCSIPATVTVNVVGVNDPPTAQDDSAITEENALVTIPVVANDSDPDGDFLVVESVTEAGNGSVINAGSSVSYIPAPGFNGVDTFSYTITDNNGGTSTATVTVSVAAVNDPPYAQDDGNATDEETPVTIDVLANDSDPDGDSLIIQSVSQPANGAVVSDGTGVIYTPNPGFDGIETFTYTISDGNGGTDQATVTVAVAAVNDPPVAQGDSSATDEETPATIAVLANDSDPDADVLIVQSVSQPPGGTVANNGSDVTYIPDPGFSGIDTFTYTISDGNGGTDQATVTVAVAAVNDRPTAQDDSDATDEETPVTIDVLANDSDPDGDVLIVESVSHPSNGAVVNDGTAVTYTPDPGFNGIDTFTYTVSDGNGGTDQATVTVAVAAINDPPVAQDDTDATDEETPVAIDVMANDSDPDGDALIIQSVSQPANGTAVNDGNGVTYTPDPGFNGIDTFTYTIYDGNGGTATAGVTVTVIGTNDPPIAQDDDTATEEDSPVTISVLANDADPDGDAVRVESLSQPLHGAAVLSGASIIYTPVPGFVGTDTFTYTITDGRGGTSTAKVTVTVIGADDPPVAQDDSHATEEDSPVTVSVLTNDSDPDGDGLIVESVTQPANGAVRNDGIDVTYTPDPGFTGVDSFTYTVSDGNGGTDTAFVTIVVSPVNDPPVAQNDSATTDENTLVAITILANDSDPDGDFLLVESLGQPSHGSVLNTGTGVSYIPDAGFQGLDTFTYIVSDGNGGTDTATVTVSVAGANGPPVARDDNGITDEGVPVTISILVNDSDPDGDPLTIESLTQPEHGTVVIIGGDVTYTPEPGFSGLDEFAYTVSDGNGGVATATVLVAVAPTNDPPVAQDDSETTEQDTPVTIAVLLNDSDPDGDPLVVESVSQPLHGTIVDTGTELVYTPHEGFSGTDTFVYTVSDGNGLTATATVTIGVAAVVGRGGATDASACAGRVIISEVAWAGTVSDPRNEWIELRNLGTTLVDLDGWVLQWRRSHPSTPEEHVWKVVELSGSLQPASVAACDRPVQDTEGIRIFKESPEAVEWFVSSPIDETDGGYYVLERRHDETISDRPADLLYDTSRLLTLELSDLGEVIMLVNDFGEVVDTANASNLGRNGWAAGSATTFGTMERVDPLGADVAGNWHTNAGIVIRGEDTKGRPLRATPGDLNSPILEDLAPYAEIELAPVRAGDVLQIDLALPRSDRRTAGWPWISVSRPGFAGAGASAASAGYAFSGRYQGGEHYVLDIDTSGLPPGSYVFWVIYGRGEAILVPIIVTP